MLSRFRGCLFGGLVGDCLGAPFEGNPKPDKLNVEKFLDKLEKNVSVVEKSYTDDTAMTIAIVNCLIENRSLDPVKLAAHYCQTYFDDPTRGYGAAVPNVMHTLRKEKLADPLGPAKSQFNGSGSFGNGAAMRISPVALFCFNKSIENVIKMTKISAIITHTHPLAVNGAILQALAIQFCLTKEPKEFDVAEFLNFLYSQMRTVESEVDIQSNITYNTYQQQITKIINLLDENPSIDEVVSELGNSVAALWSVPSAIYCFIKGLKSIEQVQTQNIFRRTVEYAILLGGDTDTIACIAGSLLGSLFGEKIIPLNILMNCEYNEELGDLANLLYDSTNSLQGARKRKHSET